MPALRFRITGPDSAAESMLTTLSGIETLDRVEEVGEPQLAMRDDSSSADSADDDLGGVHNIELHASAAKDVDYARDIVEARAFELGVAVEFVDDF